MPTYCVNKVGQSGSGDHEVHDLNFGCPHLPSAQNQLNLGWFSSCSEAVSAAKNYYSDVNGCYYCAKDCHTT